MEILNGLKKHIENEKASFHMPGHKNGAAFFATPLENDIFKYDTTELKGTDSLFAPDDIIKRAQDFAAKCYFADEAHFLVNGSTSGILSMFFSCFSEGDLVIMDRNCHKSAISALILTGAVPIWLTPEKNTEINVSGKISPEKIENLFKKNHNIKGVYITSPNYYGICSDIKKIAEIAHKNNAVLLVDEAHGAHFPFSPLLPDNAISLGADLATVSLHKSLAAPNQTALLLKKGSRVSSPDLKNAVNMFQTTSPSYILMAYQEAAILSAAENGATLTERLIKYQDGIKRAKTDDIFKIIVSFKHKKISGYTAEKILIENYGIYPELSDGENVLLMSSYGNTEEDFRLLKQALSEIEAMPNGNDSFEKYPSFSDIAPAFSPKEVHNKKSLEVSLSDACGMVSADTVTAFPPCIPIILPGEIITKEHISFLSSFSGKISGTDDGKIKILCI